MLTRNLLAETVNAIIVSQHATSDVAWVGASNQWYCTWAQFAEVAKEINYDGGYGTAYVSLSLVVVFNDDDYIVRWEEEGLEGWQLVCRPIKPSIHIVQLSKVDLMLEESKEYKEYKDA